MKILVVDDHQGFREDATAAAERILAAVRTPFRLDGADVSVGISIGIAVFRPGAGNDADALLHAADSAMYLAKARGRGRYAWAE